MDGGEQQRQYHNIYCECIAESKARAHGVGAGPKSLERLTSDPNDHRSEMVCVSRQVYEFFAVLASDLRAMTITVAQRSFEVLTLPLYFLQVLAHSLVQQRCTI